DRDPPVLRHDRVKRIKRVGIVHSVKEPELLFLKGFPLGADERVIGIKALPALGARGRLDLVGKLEASGGLAWSFIHLAFPCWRQCWRILRCTSRLFGILKCQANPMSITLTHGFPFSAA